METVKIGNQTWMVKNLACSHYLNGDSIESPKLISEFQELAAQKIGAVCSYRNQPWNKDEFGLLYNWHALTDPRGIAPQGWRVPTIDDWNELCTTLGEDQAGSLLKGDRYWLRDIHFSGDDDASQAMEIQVSPRIGFDALPAGGRGRFGSDEAGNGFFGFGDSAYFWSATECPDDENEAFFSLIYSGSPDVQTFSTNSKSCGWSVRLIKN